MLGPIGLADYRWVILGHLGSMEFNGHCNSGSDSQSGGRGEGREKVGMGGGTPCCGLEGHLRYVGSHVHEVCHLGPLEELLISVNGASLYTSEVQQRLCPYPLLALGLSRPCNIVDLRLTTMLQILAGLQGFNCRQVFVL